MFSLSAPMICGSSGSIYPARDRDRGIADHLVCRRCTGSIFVSVAQGGSRCTGNRVSDCVVGIGSADPTTGSEKIQFGAHSHKCTDTDRRRSSRNRT